MEGDEEGNFLDSPARTPDVSRRHESSLSAGDPNDFSKMQMRVKSLEADITRLRLNPVSGLRDYLIHRILFWLSHRLEILPIRSRRSLAVSAAKRSPKRDLAHQNHDGSVPVSQFQLHAAFSGQRIYDPNRPNVIVVTHDISRTGAPILALNLVEFLAQNYNVTTLCLRMSGELLDFFAGASITVHITENTAQKQNDLRRIIQDICKATHFSFAIVNSIESASVLQPLSQEGVAIISLVHEFASSTKPKSAFKDLAQYSRRIVFSTELTLENARSEIGTVEEKSVSVLPQGKCVIPTPAIAEAPLNWTTLLQSTQAGGKRFVVLGAGAVQYRKGVDLFIETASRVIHDHKLDDALFLWVGAGYDPVHDLLYSAYLRDQIERAQLRQHVVMIPETPKIEEFYQHADILLLSSRLDPLPNVAIDAMCESLPVLCFDSATGIADFLATNGLREICVAPFLDTSAMAQKIAALASDGDLCRSISEKLGQRAREAFSFDSYAKKIIELAREASGE